MARYSQDWDDIGRRVQDIVDRAVSSHDYQKLDQTIRQVVEKAMDVGSEAVRRAVDNAPKHQTQQPEAPQRNLPVLYGATGGKTAVAVVKIVGGGILSLTSLGLSITALVLDILTGGGSWMLTTVLAALMGSGIGLIGNGISGLNRLGRFKMYRKVLGQKTHCALDKLARSVGKSEKFVRREVRKMIGERLFLEGHLDNEEKQLIVSDETYRLFEQSRLQLERRQKEQKRLAEAEKARREASGVSPQVQEVLDKGDAFVREIRNCNEAIPGEEISGKISRIELIVERIFDRAETNPEIIPDLKKMMDYYLPMTVKLLNAYAQMDSQPVQGETIRSSKREIEATLDTLNLAFEKLLDSVFEDTALDISSDISVLHTLLAQEGLTEDELTKMKKTQ